MYRTLLAMCDKLRVAGTVYSDISYKCAIEMYMTIINVLFPNTDCMHE